MGKLESSGKDKSREESTGDNSAMEGVFTDALCPGEVVIAYLPTHGKWKRANVVDIRRKRSNDVASLLLFGSQSSGLKIADVEEGPDAYEYYVHYKQMNRRHDRWITYSEIRLITDEDSGRDHEDEEEEEEEDENRASHRRSTRLNRIKQEEDEDEDMEDDEEDEEEVEDEVEEDEEDEDEEDKRSVSSSRPSELSYSDESDHEGMNENDIIEWEKATKVKRIDKILIGNSIMETWYWSPFPADFQDCALLYICEFCLSFYREKSEFQDHCTNCKYRHPPGDEIYSDPSPACRMSVFEVDGFFERVYCENLCYLSKLFLDHKRFDRFDVSNFYFYVVGEWMAGPNNEPLGFRFIGYFSKEKQSTNRNLSCIMSLPCYQRRGFGSFIIEFSYELSKVAKKMGTPERPLSDLGKRTYLRWWLQRILRVLKDRTEPISISDISNATYILPEDIKMTLDEYKLLYYYKGQYHIALTQERLETLWIDNNPNHVRVNPLYLHWTPLELPDPNMEL
jgi:hypothetical protein